MGTAVPVGEIFFQNIQISLKQLRLVSSYVNRSVFIHTFLQKLSGILISKKVWLMVDYYELHSK